MTLKDKDKEIMNLKEKLMRLDGLELARTQKHNLASNQSPLNFNLTTPSNPSDGGESARKRQDVRISTLEKLTKSRKAKIVLV